MTPPTASALFKAPISDETPPTVTTVFGDIPYHPETIVHFPQGILGFPYNKQYILVDIKHPNAAHFILMQPLEVPAHSFLILPLKKESGLIPQEAVDAALAQYGMDAQDVEIFVIGTFQKEGESLKKTLNLNAPIFVNFKHKVGVQHVFTGKGYDMEHPLTTDE